MEVDGAVSPARDDHRPDGRGVEGSGDDRRYGGGAETGRLGGAPAWADGGGPMAGSWMTGSPPRVVDIDRIRMADSGVSGTGHGGPVAGAQDVDAVADLEAGREGRADRAPEVQGGAPGAAGSIDLEGGLSVTSASTSPDPGEQPVSGKSSGAGKPAWLPRGRGALGRGAMSLGRAVSGSRGAVGGGSGKGAGRGADGSERSEPDDAVRTSGSMWSIPRGPGSEGVATRVVAEAQGKSFPMPAGASDGVFAPSVGRAVVAPSGRATPSVDERADGGSASRGSSVRGFEPSAQAEKFPDREPVAGQSGLSASGSEMSDEAAGAPGAVDLGSGRLMASAEHPGGAVSTVPAAAPRVSDDVNCSTSDEKASGRGGSGSDALPSRGLFVDAVAREAPVASGVVGQAPVAVRNPADEGGDTGVFSASVRVDAADVTAVTGTGERAAGRVDVGNGQAWVRDELIGGTDSGQPGGAAAGSSGQVSSADGPGPRLTGKSSGGMDPGGAGLNEGGGVQMGGNPTGIGAGKVAGGAAPPVLKKLAAVERLRAQVATLPLTLGVEDIAEVRREREDLLSQLDDYILPRLQRPDAPALAVIGGSTGAGKSTLTNSIVGREVTRSGVLRPTTRSPVLVHHPSDSGAFLSQRILPGLARVTSEGPEPIQPIDPNAPRITGLRLVPYEGLPPGLALLDAPDIDSLVETNRDLAVQLLQAADLWVFVTTAARYADAMPWEMLKQAAERGVAIAVVLDRVPPEALQELRIHLATKLRDRGLATAALFTVPESDLENGFLPLSAVRPLRDWLRRIAGNERSRSVVVERTLKGALQSLPVRARLLAKAAATQADGWSTLYEEIDSVFIPARFAMLDQLTDGSVMTGQVLSHWQEFIARGDLASRLGGTTTSRVQRLGAALSAQEQVGEPLATTICQAVSGFVHQAVRTAIEQTIALWREHSYGVELLAARGHQVAPTEQEKLLAKPVEEWRRAVTGQVTQAWEKAQAENSDLTADERTVVDVVFALVVARDHHAKPLTPLTGGTPVEEPGAGAVTEGARMAVQELLGEETVLAIVEEARNDLLMRAGTVIDDERLRLERVLESPEHLGLRVGALMDAASAVNIAE